MHVTMFPERNLLAAESSIPCGCIAWYAFGLSYVHIFILFSFIFIYFMFILYFVLFYIIWYYPPTSPVKMKCTVALECTISVRAWRFVWLNKCSLSSAYFHLFLTCTLTNYHQLSLNLGREPQNTKEAKNTVTLKCPLGWGSNSTPTFNLEKTWGCQWKPITPNHHLTCRVLQYWAKNETKRGSTSSVKASRCWNYHQRNTKQELDNRI